MEFVTTAQFGLRDRRPVYVAKLASVTEHNGTLHVLCFSDDGTDIGPHPISQEELRAAFTPGNGWNVAAIEPDRIQTTTAYRPGLRRSNATIKRTQVAANDFLSSGAPDSWNSEQKAKYAKSPRARLRGTDERNGRAVRFEEDE
jgi:hypothetical protein